MSAPPSSPDRCELCGGDSHVYDTRPSNLPTKPVVCRRRRCLKCGARWETYEQRGRIIGRENPRPAPRPHAPLGE